MNDYDLFSNRTTDFGHRSKWIVVSEISVRENLTVWAKDLENVAFLPAMKMVCSVDSIMVIVYFATVTSPL